MFQNTANALQRGLSFGNPTESIEDVEQTTLAEQKLLNLENAKRDKQASLGYNYDLDLQTNLSNAVDAQVYTDKNTGERHQIQWSKDAKGNSVQTKVPFTGETEQLYIDQTASGDYKLGLAAKSFNSRYNPNDPIAKAMTEEYARRGIKNPDGSPKVYGWEPGPLGVTPQDGALMDITLPRNYAKAFEYGVHSNPEQIKNRSIGLGAKSPQTEALYGSGQTEYTTPNAPMWNADYIGSANTITADTPLPQNPKYYTNKEPSKKASEYRSKDDLQLAEAASAGILTLFGKGAELFGEAMEQGANVLELPGKAVKNLGEWQEKYNLKHKPTKNDKVADTVYKWQEAFAQGAKDLGGWMNKDNVFATALREEGQQIQREQKDYRESGKWNELANYDPRDVQKYGEEFANKVAKDDYVGAVSGLFDTRAITAFSNSLPEMLAMANPWGLGTVMASNTNKNLNDLYSNAEKNGQKVTKGDVVVSAGLSVVSTYLDRLGDKAVLSSNIAGLNTVLSSMPAAVKNKVLQAYAKPLAAIGITSATVTGKVAMEGGTEGIQEIMEGKASDKTLQTLSLTDKEKRSALEATGIGMGAGGVPVAASTSVDIAKDTMKAFDTAVTDKLYADRVAKNVKETAKQKLSEEQVSILDEVASRGGTIDTMTEAETTRYNQATMDAETKEAVANINTESLKKGLKSTLEETISDVEVKLNEAGMSPEEIVSYTDALTKRISDEGYFKTEETTASIDETIPSAEPIVDTIQEQDTAIDETPVSEDKAVNEKVKRAGLVNVLTPQDKAAGLSIELTTMDDGERLTNIGKTKTKALDVYDVDDKVFSMILNDNFTAGTMEKLIQGKNITTMRERLTGHLESTAKVQQEIKGIADNLSKTIATPKGKKILQSIFNGEEVTLEKALRATALALNGVRSGITSEADINIQNGLEIPAHKGARRLGLNVQLGKELYNSYGIKVAGEASVINRKYAEVGDKIIALAEEAGLVKVKKDQEIVAHKLHTEAGKSLYTEKELHKAGVRQAKDRKDASGKTTPMMMDDIITLVDNKSDKGNRLIESATGYAMSMLTKLLKPINYELPTTEPVTEVKAAPGMTISEKHEKIVQDINELSYNIKPEFIQLLKEVKKAVGKYKNVDEALRQDPLIAGLIGVENTNTALNKLGEEGRSSNRKRDLLQILENLDMFDNEGQFHFNYDMAVNQRIHVVQTILDFQGGKYMNRPMITGGEYTTNTQKEYDFLVESIAQEAKLPVDAKAVEAYMNEHKVTKKEATKKVREAEVKNPTNKHVVKAMKLFSKYGEIKLHQLLELSKDMGMNSPIALLADLRAVYDISTAKDYKVTTSSQAQADAKASGIMNTMLNLSGIKEVQKLLAKLGVGKKDTELSDLDPYLILLDGVKEKWEGTKYEDTIKPVEEQLTKLGIDIRDIAKYAIIPWFYGQHYKKTEIEMANSIAVDVVNVAIKESNQDAIDEVNEILESKKYSIDSRQQGQEGTIDIQSITTEDVAKLTGHYKKNLTKYYIAAIEDTFPGVTEYRKKVGQLYEILNANEWKGKLRTAMSALEGESDKDAFKHKMDVKKNKQTFTTSIDGKSVVAYNKMFNNETSLKVNPQHSSDAALLLKSIGNVIADLKEAGKEVPGIMTVHDNVITTPEVALMIKREYDRLTVELAGKYDFLHAVAQEVEDIIKEKEAAGDTKGAKNLQAKLDEIMKGEKDIREAKAAYLDGLEVSILGSKDIKLDTKETVKKEPKAKTEEKAEPKADKEVNKVDKVYGELLTTFTLAMNEVKGKPISAENKAKIIEGLETLKDVVSKTHIATLNKVIDALKGNIDTNGIGIERTTKFEGTTGVIGIELEGLRKDPRTNYTAIMNPDRLVEILGHEIEHALEYEYISTHMDSKEVRYLKKVLDRVISPEFMDKLSPATRHRINTSININDVDDARRITELSSVLNNEMEYANEILEVLATNKSQVMKVLHNVIEAIKNWLSKMTPETISKLIDEGLTKDGKIGSTGTVAALQQLSNQAEVYLAEHPDSTFSMKGNIKSKRDIYSNAYLSPYEAANSIVARSNSYISKYMMVYGGLVVDVFGPSVKAAHEKGMNGSDLYKQMILLIRTGMMSETAQQMAQFLKVTGDSMKELLDNMQGVATEISQKSMALHEEMAVLDRLVKKTYPDKKDQVRIYQIFSKTGISNLTADKEIMKSVMDGKLDVKEALKKIGSQVENREVLNEVADVYLGVSTRPDRINTGMAEDHTAMAKTYVALKVLSKIDGAEDMLNKMGKPLKQQLMHLAIMNQTMSEQVNERGTMYEGDTYAQASRYYNDYDGHYSMDIHDGQYEFNMVTEGDMKSSRYSESEDWILLKEPKGENVGLVARKLLTPMNTPGMGLNYNRFNNGFYMDEDQSQKMQNKLDKMENPKVYLNENGIVQDGTRFRFLLDEKTKVEKLGMMQNVAEGMYRTMIHNKELIESQTVRNMIIDAGIQKVETEEELQELNDFLVENKKKAIHKREETSPFIYINPKTYKGYDSLPPQIKLLYKTPENMTTYEGFNERITLVKKAEAHEILGHKNVQFFSDSRGMAKAEMVFKNLVIMSKLHMIVTDPMKLAVDIASNIGILSTMDVPFTEIGRGGKKGWEGYSRISRLRSELGTLQMEARMVNAGIKIDGVTDSYDKLLKKIESKKRRIETDDFYDAYKAGFIQSYSTSLIMKEFDVISGLQKDIDTVVDSITLDKEGNPNDIHKAIKKWMSFGLEVDSLLTSASKLSKINGTNVGKEMAEIADRLRSKKDAQSVARYVSEIIGAPSSEIVTYGGAVMVISDALSKYTLAKHLLGELGGNRIVNPKTDKPYTKIEAYAKANETFIDFRYNMPPAVKALSDYGILMFPSFWMRTQKVIASLILYHPATAIGGYMIEDYLNMGSANIIDANFGEMVYEGTVVHDPIGILSPNSIAWWL